MTAFSEQTVNNGTDTSGQQVSDKGLAAIVYFLYIAGFFTGITALVGVVLAQVNLASSTGLVASHYRYQIRTFWYGLLIGFVGFLLTFVLVGWFVMLGWFIWTVYRIVAGLSALNRGQSI